MKAYRFCWSREDGHRRPSAVFTSRGVDLRVIRKGLHLSEVYKFFGILHPLHPCLHFGQTHSTKLTQPPLLRLYLRYLLPPSLCRRRLSMAPKTIGDNRRVRATIDPSGGRQVHMMSARKKAAPDTDAVWTLC